MSLVKGGTYTSSCKQRLNTKSSTEADLVAIDDAMAQILWTRHFLAVQVVQLLQSTRTIKVQSCYQRMAEYPVASIPNI